MPLSCIFDIMGKAFILFFILCFANISIAGKSDNSNLYGQWKGIKMFQDENTYDGSTFFLPNEGEMILDENSLKMYYYPYFKSAEYEITYSNESIHYKINDKEIRCDYKLSGDTLTFKMFYINKVYFFILKN